MPSTQPAAELTPIAGRERPGQWTEPSVPAGSAGPDRRPRPTGQRPQRGRRHHTGMRTRARRSWSRARSA